MKTIIRFPGNRLQRDYRPKPDAPQADTPQTSALISAYAHEMSGLIRLWGDLKFSPERVRQALVVEHKARLRKLADIDPALAVAVADAMRPALANALACLSKEI
jgi:hypothetical protein